MLRVTVVAAVLAVTAADTSCPDLAGGLYVKGHDVGTIVAEICKNWPFPKTPFPIQTTSDAFALLNFTFKDGGMYDRAKSLAYQRQYSGEFCWRRQLQRPVVTPSNYSCPRRFNEWFVPENPVQVYPKWRNGSLLCTKDCSDICGEFKSRGEIYPGLCGCRSKTPEALGTAGYHYISYQNPDTVPAQPDGCDAIHTVNHSEVCYGSCPNSSIPTALFGRFKPVCSGMCNGTNRSFGCGFGCATTAQKCFSTVVDQVGSAVQTIGDTIGFMTGDVVIPQVAAAVVGTMEFGLTALTDLVTMGITAWSNYKRNRQTVGLIAALVAVVKEVKGDMPQMKDLYGHFIKMVGDLIVALRSWHGIRWSSGTKKLEEALLKHGAAILLDAYKMLDAFAWPTCDGPPPEPVPHSWPQNTSNDNNGSSPGWKPVNFVTV